MNKKPQYCLKSSLFLKAILLLIIMQFILSANNTFSQSITWQRTYSKNIQAIGNDACQTTDGNFVIAGTTVVLNIGPAIFAMKINGFGDTIWTKTILSYQSENNEGLAIAPANDGAVVITGINDSIYTCKLDINGNLIWYKNYPAFSRHCYDIKKTLDNGFILCGYINSEPYEAFVFKIDSLGNFQWDRTYSAPFLKVFYSVALTVGGYLLTGFESNNTLDPHRLLIISINNNGDSLWQRDYYINNKGANGMEIIESNQSYYIGGGSIDSTRSQLFFMKINSIGDSLYVRTFPTNGRAEYFGSFGVLNSNRFVFGYDRDSSFGLSNGIGMISDSNGNIIKKSVFTNTYFRWGSLRAITPISNGDILFSGTANLLNSGTRVVYAVRTDSLLSAPTYIGIFNNSEVIAKDYIIYQNYPNPFNATTILKYELKKKANIKIEIFDILGRLIEKPIDNSLEAGKYEFNWKSNNFATGIYFAKMTVNNKSYFVIKMLLIK